MQADFYTRKKLPIRMYRYTVINIAQLLNKIIHGIAQSNVLCCFCAEFSVENFMNDAGKTIIWVV